jgi:diguanylate cyclase (GGDEF)-like protein
MHETSSGFEGAGAPASKRSFFERLRHRRKVWAAGAALLIVLGAVGSISAAATVAGNAAQKSNESFGVSSADVASNLKLAIQHEQDLIVSAAGFVVGNPAATETEFVRWADSVHALQRYPELTGFGESVIVPASQLAAFAARSVSSLSPQVGPNGTFQVTPPGRRPFYCLSQVEQLRNTGAAVPAGYDYCAGAQGRASLASRDSGLGAYAPITFGTVTSLAIETPVYRGGVVPTTVALRRRAFVGWLGMSVVPEVLLAASLANAPGTAVSLSFGGGRSKVGFTDGQIRPHARHMTIDLDNGWTVETFAVLPGDGILDHGGALALLMTGIGLSVLLGLLVFVLGTGRGRALALVTQRTDELRHQALHDALTGLPNRALIMDRIEQLLVRSRRNGTTAAAMYVDLDDFKNVNDTLGHAAGDQLLLAVAGRLSASLRAVDTIGRMGGDEFVVLVEGGSLVTGPESIAQRLLEVMRRPFELDLASSPLTVTISVGVAMAANRSPSELLRDADVALYLAKAAGKNSYMVFRPEMDTKIQQRYELEFDLRCALEDNQFRLLYQPVYDLEDLSVVGCEALLRWEHPTLGQIQPDIFIPLLESSGQIVEVGRWVLIEACRQTAAWHAEGSALGISVNVSGRQLDRDVIIDDVGDALALSGLDPGRLTIEVTETALMRDTTAAARRLAELKALGIMLAIDDFGTGYSSLAYLQKFPVDCLKIDRAFTNAISTTPESRALIRTVVQLGRDLGLKTLAEGVETTEELDHLRKEHVDHAQGFLMARPLSPEAIESTILGLTPTAATPHHRGEPSRWDPPSGAVD